jgi:hypothetical protein
LRNSLEFIELPTPHTHRPVLSNHLVVLNWHHE